MSLKKKKVYEALGLIRSLDKIFGHTVNSKGYKVLNAKIGAVYGDAINFQRATAICERLMELGYSPENICFGTGATWQAYSTRDNLGIALKTTKAIVNGKTINVVKDPKTAPTKRSPKGEVTTLRTESGAITWYDSEHPITVVGTELMLEDNVVTLTELRNNVTQEINSLL